MIEDKMEGEGGRCEFLRCLPPNTSVYQYSDFQALEEATGQEYSNFLDDDNQSPIVVFEGIPPEEVEKHQEEFPGKIDYNNNLQLLILKAPFNPHEACADMFDDLFRQQIRQMGVRDQVAFRVGSRVYTPSRRKEPDRSYVPRDSTIQGRSGKWPTIALEAYFSESREQVKRDAEWWLNESSGDVKFVITIDVKRPSGNIYITAWERGDGKWPEPRATQDVGIFRGENGRPSDVNGDDLVLKFRHLLLRDPVENHGERDFIFTKRELLEEIGERTWEAMEDLPKMRA